ncbi:MAG: T9SS type A sorting domain-containing protein, partial [Candidatus Neomarinimicrobiota bacterium]
TASGEYGFQLTVGRLFPVQEITKQFPAGWNMLGLPLTPIERTITNLFGDDISGYYYPYSYSNTSGYSLIENIVQGHGYWLGLLEPAILDFAGDSLTDTISISLPKGSNIIGNPFKHKIGKENLTFSKDGVTQSFSSAVANNLISNVMHTWKNVGSGVYAATDTLSVWWGAWLYALVDGLSVNYLPGAVSKSLTEKVMEIGEGWQVNLSLSAAWGKENSGFLGENASASDGFDALYDYIEPPEAPSGKFLRGFFRHDKWTEITTLYDSDIRPLKSPNAEWLYTVNSSQNGEVVLTWDIQNLPSDKSLTLIMPDGSEIDLRQQKELTFKYNGEITFRIVKQFSTTIAEKRLLPDKFALQQNYPNPFNPVTTIKYQLPKAVKVELTVYNTIGQTARTIVNTHQEPGYYTVSFDASGLGSGVYFYRIKAGNFSDLKKCIVVK